MVTLPVPGMAAPDAGPAAVTSRPSSFADMLLADAPYAAMLALALGGIAYEDLVGHSILSYWLVLMPVFAGLCVIAGMARARAEGRLIALMWTQGLHWGAFLAAMYVITLHTVQIELNDRAVALLQLMMLALGAFVAGVHSRAWRISVVGIVLGAAVPVVAWVQGSATLIMLCGVALVLVSAGFWFARRRFRVLMDDDTA